MSYGIHVQFGKKYAYLNVFGEALSLGYFLGFFENMCNRERYFFFTCIATNLSFFLSDSVSILALGSFGSSQKRSKRAITMSSSSMIFLSRGEIFVVEREGHGCILQALLY